MRLGMRGRLWRWRRGAARQRAHQHARRFVEILLARQLRRPVEGARQEVFHFVYASQKGGKFN